MATYSFLDVQASINGVGGTFNIGQGSATAEEGITVEMEEDKDTMTIGADGRGMHSLHAGKSGKITVRLLKTSPTNQMLSQMYNLQTSSSAAHGRNTITINDVARGDNITGSGAAFAKHTGLTYAKDGGMNEWVFNCIRINFTLGSGLA